MPIVAMTPNERSYYRMAFNWGVTPFLSTHCKTIDEAFKIISTYSLEHELVSNGDLVVITAGSPFGVSGTTNMMIVESIGDVLVRGELGFGNKLHGNVTLVLSPEAKKPYTVRGQILVMAKCDESYIPLIQESVGFILQNHIDDSDSEKFALQVAQTLGKTVVVRADAAVAVLKEGQLVTLDPERALIYKGVVM